MFDMVNVQVKFMNPRLDLPKQSLYNGFNEALLLQAKDRRSISNYQV
jgi:hypothetical protein